jgi:hypothetical protein
VNRTVQVCPKKGNRCHRKWNIMFRVGSRAQMAATLRTRRGAHQEMNGFGAITELQRYKAPITRHDLRQLRKRIAGTRLQREARRQVNGHAGAAVGLGGVASYRTSFGTRGSQVQILPLRPALSRILLPFRHRLRPRLRP